MRIMHCENPNCEKPNQVRQYRLDESLPRCGHCGWFLPESTLKGIVRVALHPARLSNALVLILIIAASALSTILVGRFTVAAPGGGTGFIYVVDRLTGSARLCNPQGCRTLPETN
jgi:hypothetical protein